jgi:hypothetical protein
VSNLGNLVTLPLLAMLLRGDASVIPVLIAGEVLLVLGMVLFGLAVLTLGRQAPAAA